MFDFKLLVESLLLEANEAFAPTTGWYNNAVSAFKTKLGSALTENPNSAPDEKGPLARSIKSALISSSNVTITSDLLPLVPFIDLCRRIRAKLSTKPTEVLKFIEAVQGKYSAGNEIYDLINKWKDTEIKSTEYDIKDINVSEAKRKISGTQTIKQKLDASLLNEVNNLSILGATVKLVNKRSKKDYTAFVTDVFQHPEKYAISGEKPIPADFAENTGYLNAEYIIAAAIDSRALFDLIVNGTEVPIETTGPSDADIEKHENDVESKIITPAGAGEGNVRSTTNYGVIGSSLKLKGKLTESLGAGTVALVAGAWIVGSAALSWWRTRKYDPVYGKFITYGKIEGHTETYNINWVKSQNLEPAKEFIECLKGIAFYTRVGDTKTGAAIKGAVGIASSGGIEGVTSTLGKF
jgi:hypothetical protein